MTHSCLVPEWTIKLPAVVNGKPYVSWGLALEIVEICVDGVSLEPSEGGLPREDGSVYPAPVEAIVYEVNARDFQVHRWRDGKIVDGPLLKYSLPKDATHIEIKYVVHLRDGMRSSLNTVSSFELSALLGLRPIQPSQPTRGNAPRG